MKKIIFVVLLGAIIIGVLMFVRGYLDEKNAWKIEVTNDYINVRVYNSQNTKDSLGTVKAGQIFRVLEFSEKDYITKEDDQLYVWYKIEYKPDTFGWIASSRTEPYVKEINNPDAADYDKFIIDYGAPVVKYYEDTYETYNISSIKYDHLEIIEVNEYEITHRVFIEENPKDRPGPQYWIEYRVEDAAEFVTTKLQRISFEVAPSADELIPFEELD